MVKYAAQILYFCEFSIFYGVLMLYFAEQYMWSNHCCWNRRAFQSMQQLKASSLVTCNQTYFLKQTYQYALDVKAEHQINLPGIVSKATKFPIVSFYRKVNKPHLYWEACISHAKFMSEPKIVTFKTTSRKETGCLSPTLWRQRILQAVC